MAKDLTAKAIIFAKIELPYGGWKPCIYTQGNSTWIEGVETTQNWFVFSIEAKLVAPKTIHYISAVRTTQHLENGIFLPEKINLKPVIRSVHLVPGEITVINYLNGKTEECTKQLDQLDGVIMRAHASAEYTDDKLAVVGSPDSLGVWEPKKGQQFVSSGFDTYITQVKLERSATPAEYKLIRAGLHLKQPLNPSLMVESVRREFRTTWEGTPFKNKIIPHISGLQLHITSWGEEETKTVNLDDISVTVNVLNVRAIQMPTHTIALPRDFLNQTEVNKVESGAHLENGDCSSNISKTNISQKSVRKGLVSVCDLVDSAMVKHIPCDVLADSGNGAGNSDLDDSGVVKRVPSDVLVDSRNGAGNGDVIKNVPNGALVGTAIAEPLSNAALVCSDIDAMVDSLSNCALFESAHKGDLVVSDKHVEAKPKRGPTFFRSLRNRWHRMTRK